MTTMFTSTDRGIDPASADLLFRGAHTAYAFTDEPVHDAELAEIYDLVRHAPTAMNSQPLRVTFVRSAAAKERLLPHVAEGNRAKLATAPVVAILAVDLDFHENLPRVMPHAPNAKDLFADDTHRERPATSSSRSAQRVWTPVRWADSTASVSTRSSSAEPRRSRSCWSTSGTCRSPVRFPVAPVWSMMRPSPSSEFLRPRPTHVHPERTSHACCLR